ncbi:hypothetical protein NP493_178g01020 [Ridgeia piscesae]|uniref:Uncharacterized protein n=1 Tax=Ridgeia piscesae TaxID=27915 RepID=A0AAD9P2R5_RIDPI|nr:hypothetical protein NP493_178g01020 [Ridgeia piscesae]
MATKRQTFCSSRYNGTFTFSSVLF